MSGLELFDDRLQKWDFLPRGVPSGEPQDPGYQRQPCGDLGEKAWLTSGVARDPTDLRQSVQDPVWQPAPIEDVRDDGVKALLCECV